MRLWGESAVRIPVVTRDRGGGGPVYPAMGYIIALVLLLLVVPLVFMMLSRRTTSAGGLERRRDRGMTVSQPSSDQPEPRSDSGVNKLKPGSERRLPPG